MMSIICLFSKERVSCKDEEQRNKRNPKVLPLLYVVDYK